jgi:EF hand
MCVHVDVFLCNICKHCVLLPCMYQTTHNRIFKAFDRDNSGGVSYSEFIAFVLHCDISIVKSSGSYGDSDSDDSSINGSYTKRYTIALSKTTLYHYYN